MVESISSPKANYAWDAPADPVRPVSPDAAQTPRTMQAVRTAQTVRAIRKARDELAALAVHKSRALQPDLAASDAPAGRVTPVIPETRRDGVVQAARAALAALPAQKHRAPQPVRVVPDVSPDEAADVTQPVADAQEQLGTPGLRIGRPVWIAAVAIILLAGMSIAVMRGMHVTAAGVLFRSTGIDMSVLWDPPQSFHVKQTITLETPAGEVTSSVVSSRVLLRTLFAGYAAGPEYGEALIIPLPDGRHLFAVHDAFLPPLESLLPPNGTLIREWKLQAGKSPPTDVPKTGYPAMVTFSDVNDSLTMLRVDPFNLKASFGQSYRIKSYTAGITEEPVTDGRIAALLPWIGPFPEPRICPPIGSSDVHACRNFTHGHFRFAVPSR